MDLTPTPFGAIGIQSRAGTPVRFIIREMVPTPGLEPGTSTFGESHSIHLSYVSEKINGGS